MAIFIRMYSYCLWTIIVLLEGESNFKYVWQALCSKQTVLQTTDHIA